MRAMSEDEVRLQAIDLIEKAGGSAKICDESDKMFKRFGVSKVRFLKPSELKEYPAISALGKVDGIWPGEPPYIKVRVGPHGRGFVIQIASPSSKKDQKLSGGTIIPDSCISVHR
jgi:hypothetical protein